MPAFRTRRDFLRDLGISAAALPFILNLPSLGFANQQAKKKRDFARADEIRALLDSKGILLEDTKEGVRWKRK